MKSLKRFFHLIAVLSVISLAPCADEWADGEPPAVPRGLSSITGDGEVMLTWYHNTEPDFAGYRIYRSLSQDGPYYPIGETNLDYFLDFGLANGQTYYYAITAFDHNNNESELSYDVAYDTPRPEGCDANIFDFHEFPSYAGWNFSAYTVVAYNSASCDFYYGYDEGDEVSELYIGRPGGLIQDFGYTESLDDVTYAPENGWSLIGKVEAIVGHTYIIWTWDNHFAKVRITTIASDHIIFDWAYQVDPGNPELVKGG